MLYFAATSSLPVLVIVLSVLTVSIFFGIRASKRRSKTKMYGKDTEIDKK